MLGVVSLIGLIPGTAFGAYECFVIEERYGFNKSSVKTFAGDIIKSLLIGIILAGGLLTLFMYLYFTKGVVVFTAFFFILTALVAVIGFFAHYFTMIFNKFTPLSEGPLWEKINALSVKAGFPVKKIAVMDASKRSTKTNAYFTGFGKNKMIVLYDTLLEKLEEDEIISVLAHEMGHYKKKHVPAGMLISILNIAVLVSLSRYIVGSEDISIAFGFAELNVAFGIYVFMIFYAPLSILLSIPANILSRSFERAADGFAVLHSHKNDMVSALKKITRDNYSNLTPHPFVVFISHSHPTLSRRISDMDLL